MFFEGNVNNGSYLDISNNLVLPQLQDFYNTQFENGNFQHLCMQNGAQALTSLAVKKRLHEAFDNIV